MDYAVNQIAKLVLKYSKKNKIVDKEFADKVITLLVNALDVNDFVLEREFQLNEELLGGYDCLTKTIYVDMNRLIDHIEKKLLSEKINGIIDSKFDFILKFNLSFVNTIAHEVCHAKQYKKVAINSTDLEGELLKLSFEHNLLVLSSIANQRMLYEDEVDYITALGALENDSVYLNALPSERMACMEAVRIEKEISNVVSKSQKINDYLNVKSKMEMIRGFLNGNCPTAYILSVHNKLKNSYGLAYGLDERLRDNEQKCIQIANCNNLSVNEKFYYGLYISDNELRPKINEINNLTKKLINKN